jgi:hypothetical protein
MIVTQIVGYTLFVTIANRCVMFDALRGEASVWAAPVQPGSAQPVRHYTYDARTGITVEQIFARHGDAQDTLVQTFGFGYGRTNLLFGGPPVVSGRSAYLLVTPYWFIALIAAIWPARWLVRFIKHHGPRPRIRRGFVPAMRT